MKTVASLLYIGAHKTQNHCKQKLDAGTRLTVILWYRTTTAPSTPPTSPPPPQQPAPQQAFAAPPNMPAGYAPNLAFQGPQQPHNPFFFPPNAQPGQFQANQLWYAFSFIF